MIPSSILPLILLTLLFSAPALAAPDDDPRPIVQTSEIMAKIERGELVEYDGVIVEGGLDLSGVEFVEFSISITNSKVKGNVNFGNAILKESVNFGGTNFTEDACFSGANFSDDANFGGGGFNGNASFGGSEFNSDANFGGTRFNSNADFGVVGFNGNASFGGSEFNSDANFGKTRFNINADFGGGGFSGNADFGVVEFNGNANFTAAKFSSDANFGGAGISGDADFRWVVFSDYVYFEDSSFDHTNLTLEDARNIRILRLSNATFENGSKISLKGTDYERLYVHWDQIKDGFVYNGEAYLTLIKNFRNIEYFEDADGCYYQYRRERQSMRSWGEWSKYTDILGWVTCGYGVRPGYTIGWSFLLITVFGIAFWAFNGIYRITMPYQKNANEYIEKKYKFPSICCLPFKKLSTILRRILAALKILRKILSALLKIRLSTFRRLPGRIWNASFVKDISFKDALYFSTMVFVSQPPHDWRPKEGWKYWVMLEDVLGWLLLALFLVTLGNVMIR